MKDDLIKILAKTIKILSHELCIRTNGTDNEWEEYALAKSLYNYYKVDQEISNNVKKTYTTLEILEKLGSDSK